MSPPHMGYQNALITGASSGLGRGLSAWFAKKGVTVYAAARRTDELQKLKDECRDFSGKIIPLQLDVSNADATYEKVGKLDAESGGLDLVIANAGVGGESYGKRFDWAVTRRMIDVNVAGAAATLTGALPGMVERKRGHIVGMSSLAALQGMPRLGTYCGTKAFLATFLDGLRLDLKPLGVSVTSIHPGYVKSEMTAKNSKMPFLLETDDAVDRMGRAIERREPAFLFPWQMAMAIKTIASLPRPLFEVAARKLR